jgi:hypothetical protein
MASTDVEKGSKAIAVEAFDKSGLTEKEIVSSKHVYEDEVSYGWFLDSFRPKVENNEDDDPVLLNVLTSRHIQVLIKGINFRISTFFFKSYILCLLSI